MGAGLYTLVGLASTTAGVWVPLAFLVGGGDGVQRLLVGRAGVPDSPAAVGPPSS